MKAVVYPWVDMRFIYLAIGLQRLFKGRPALIDPRIQSGVVQHQRRLDPADLLKGDESDDVKKEE